MISPRNHQRGLRRIRSSQAVCPRVYQVVQDLGVYVKVSDEPSGTPRETRSEPSRHQGILAQNLAGTKGYSLRTWAHTVNSPRDPSGEHRLYRLRHTWCFRVILQLQLAISRQISVQTRSNFISHLPRPLPGLRRESSRIDFLVSGLIKSRRPGSQGYMRREKV